MLPVPPTSAPVAAPTASVPGGGVSLDGFGTEGTTASIPAGDLSMSGDESGAGSSDRGGKETNPYHPTPDS